MGSRQPVNVIDLDGPRLAVLTGSAAGSRVVVRSWITAIRPETVAADDAEAIGQWIGEELRKAGIHRHRGLLSVSRGDVVLKTMDFPVVAGMSDAELAGAVRLQMSRQLTMAIEGTAIDYAKLAERASPAGGGASVSVLAGAMPAERVAWFRNMARAASVTLGRIGLRCCGASTLLSDLSERRDGPVLGVLLGWASVEFVIVREGQMAFARAVDLPRSSQDGDAPAYADRVAVEAKRTWMSYQGAHGSRSASPVQLVAVIGDAELGAKVGERCGPALETGWEVVGPPATAEFPSWVTPGDRAAAAPLVGLLVEESLDRPRLDFANTKKAVDRGAVRRQRVLAGVLGAILVGGTLSILAQGDLGRMETRVAAAKQRQTDLRDEYERFQLEFLRVNHLEKWRSVRVDWLAHLAAINEQLPDPRQATADEISGRLLSEEIAFSPKRGAFSDEDWTAQQLSEFVVRGRVNHRDVAADLRGRLVNSELYTVENKGADVPDKFSLSLLTTQTTPQEKKPEKPPAKPADKSSPPAPQSQAPPAHAPAKAEEKPK